ncbi:hypothetical protein PPTG_17244 [Phytophthora nicotianae INRA-310]|uniref:Uncharacterized protein n=1 Tax=Phytophthora nicotianae (strain INRA-310) TaxID=761204 RepID=W2PKY5_PHYN3|nr:hypothetical protein PPTG_17244 [Phytophthora nicotianae INRA-310]ETN01522.1 hypothetical protein PPTG_17244 [Phytophthora nicotianae INRA-310]
MDISPKVSDFSELSSPSAPVPTPLPSAPYKESWQTREHRSCLPGRLQILLRSWMVTRWSLSRRVFSVPVPTHDPHRRQKRRLGAHTTDCRDPRGCQRYFSRF